MKKKHFTEEQIICARKEYEAGVRMEYICRLLGISTGTFYNRRIKYGRMEVNVTKRLRERKLENTKLKKLLA